MDCPHKPLCPDTAQRWQCQKRTEIERGIFRGVIERAAGEGLLRSYGLPIKPASATEKYNREVERRAKGTLF